MDAPGKKRGLVRSKRLDHRYAARALPHSGSDRDAFQRCWIESAHPVGGATGGQIEFQHGNLSSAEVSLLKPLRAWSNTLWKTRTRERLSAVYHLSGDAAHEEQFKQLAFADPLVPTTWK